MNIIRAKMLEAGDRFRWMGTVYTVRSVGETIRSRGPGGYLFEVGANASMKVEVVPPPPIKRKEIKICRVSGCDKKSHAQGYCKPHYWLLVSKTRR